jgi:hypothetical protein
MREVIALADFSTQIVQHDALLAVIGGSAICLSATDARRFVVVFSVGDNKPYAFIGRRATTFDIVVQ